MRLPAYVMSNADMVYGSHSSQSENMGAAIMVSAMT